MKKEEGWKSQLESMANPTIEQSEIVRRNIQAVARMQDHIVASRGLQERVADWITKFSGSMLFVYLHIAWFGSWIFLNTSLIKIPRLNGFDPYPFGLLTLIVSLEAIFLSTIVLISQNRQAVIDERRNDLDLQIDLLSEQKTAKIIEMLDHIIDQINSMNNSFYIPRDDEAQALKVSPEPEEMIEVIHNALNETDEVIDEKIGQATDGFKDEVKSVRKDVDRVSDQIEEVADDVRELEDNLPRK